MEFPSCQALWGEKLAGCIGYEGVECGIIFLICALNAVGNVGGGILQGEHAVNVVLFVKLIFYELRILEHIEELQVKAEAVKLRRGFVVLHIQELVFNGALVTAQHFFLNYNQCVFHLYAVFVDEIDFIVYAPKGFTILVVVIDRRSFWQVL